MKILVKGEYIESALYIAQKSVERGRRTALVTDDASMLPFDISSLNRSMVDFKGVDIYVNSQDFIPADYSLVIYYNCPSKERFSKNDICLWVVRQGSLSGDDPFMDYPCKKRMVIRDYIPHPMFDAILETYTDYEIYRVPYAEDDQLENVNIQMLGAWDFSNLSQSYKEFLTGFCKNTVRPRILSAH